MGVFVLFFFFFPPPSTLNIFLHALLALPVSDGLNSKLYKKAVILETSCHIHGVPLGRSQQNGAIFLTALIGSIIHVAVHTV